MRHRWPTVIVVGAVFLGLLAYLVVYTVRVDEVAAHYRLGSVQRIIRPRLGTETEQPVQTETGGVPVTSRAGCFFKLPLVDKVVKRDQRIRYVDGPTAQLQLPDQNQVIPRVYATWRITDPVAFERTLMGDEETARETLKQIIGGRTPEVFGRNNLHDLVNTDRQQLKFDQIERELYEAVKASVESSGKAYGIEVCSLGISWIALPQAATASVFGRMEQERKTEADKLTEEGKKVQRTLIAEAQEKRDKLLADAEAKAKAIRAEGEAEAAKSYEIFARDQDLAIFLRRMEAFLNVAKNAADKGEPITFVLSTKTEPFASMLRSGLPGEQAPSELGLPTPVQTQGGAATSAASPPGGVGGSE